LISVNGIPTTRDITQSTTSKSKLWRIGASYHIHKRFTLRAGWQVNDLKQSGETNIPSLGFSVHLPFDHFSPSIDYAFLREPDGVANMHVFSLRLIL
jgi:hypothetical protein